LLPTGRAGLSSYLGAGGNDAVVLKLVPVGPK
jgi:hypothetical protein